MKFLVFTLCVCAVSAASIVIRPQLEEEVEATAPIAAGALRVIKSVSNQDWDNSIVHSEFDVQPTGFNYAYETAGGIAAEAVGSLKSVDNVESISIQGSFKYTAPDGSPVLFTYIANEKGYQPQSDALPVGPAIPEAILRSLKYIAEHPQPVKSVKKN